MSYPNEKNEEERKKIDEQFEKGSVRFDPPSEEDMSKLDQLLQQDNDQNEGE